LKLKKKETATLLHVSKFYLLKYVNNINNILSEKCCCYLFVPLPNISWHRHVGPGLVIVIGS